MALMPTHCPSCESQLRVSKLTCPACGTQLEGSFQVPELLFLPREDLEFVVEFVKSSGSLKQMAKHLGQSYPTVRNRLNALIERMEAISEDPDERRHAILDAIAKGELSVEEGAKRLEEVR